MAYELIILPKAEKALDKLDGQLLERIMEKLARIRVRPHSFVKSLVGSPYFSLRVGKYRIILDIDGKKLIIIVIYIEKRDRVYD